MFQLRSTKSVFVRLRSVLVLRASGLLNRGFIKSTFYLASHDTLITEVFVTDSRHFQEMISGHYYN